MFLLRCMSVGAVIACCVGQTFAQTAKTTGSQTPPVPAHAEPYRMSQMTVSSPFTPLVASSSAAQAFEVPKVAHVTILPSQLAQNDSVCYALRSYGFTARDLESDAPKASKAIACTPRSAATMKGAGVSAVK